MALSLKVSYRGTLRSILTAPDPAAAATSWTAFEARIRKAFSIPADTLIAVTYVDADGDQIAIDSDEELAELLALFGGAAGGRSVRFDVRALNGGDEYVVVGGTGGDRASTASRSSSSPSASVVEQPAVVAEETTEAPSVPVVLPAADAASAPSAQPASSTSASSASSTSSSSSSSSSAPSSSSNSSSADKGKSAEAPPAAEPSAEREPENPFEKMFQNLEPHLKALQEEYEKSNMGPILEKIAEEAQTAFTPAFEEMFRARHHHHQRGGPRAWGHPGFAGRCGSRDFGFRGAGAHHPFAAGHHHPFPSHPPTTATATTDSLPALSDRRWHRVTCDGCGARAFTGPRHRCADCRDYDLCATCFADVERVHGGLRGAGGGSHAERFVTMVHPADRVENEAVAALVGMGFEATEEVRELVRRYGGRVERVVELIVRERERAYDVDA